jgi:hypothetical protein
MKEMSIILSSTIICLVKPFEALNIGVRNGTSTLMILIKFVTTYKVDPTLTSPTIIPEIAQFLCQNYVAIPVKNKDNATKMRSGRASIPSTFRSLEIPWTAQVPVWKPVETHIAVSDLL